MIDLDGMTTEEKLERLEHIVREIEAMMDECDMEEPVEDSLRSILDGGPRYVY